MISICTFKWGNKYTQRHLVNLARMLHRNLTIAWEYVIISDDVADQKMGPLLRAMGIETRVIPLWSEMRDAKLCGVRIAAFQTHMRKLIGPRFAWIDLDVVVTGNLDHVFSRTEDFVALATPQGPLHYNGSLVMMTAGARRQVYDRWNPRAYVALAPHYLALGMKHGGQSDEGWMTYVLGEGEARVGKDDGIRYFKHLLGSPMLPPGTNLVVMNGLRYDPSMPTWQDGFPWIKEHWR